MAKLLINSGIQNFTDELNELTGRTNGILKMGLYDGASVAVEAVRDEIAVLEKVTEQERNALDSGLGIAHMKVENGNVSVTIGFDGYDDHPTAKYPKGRPIAMLARAIQSGTSWRMKRPFITKAKTKKQKAITSAVKETVEKQIAQLTK